MNGRHRIVAHQHFPRLAVFAGLRQIEPGLDVLAGGAGMVAGRQQIDIDRTLATDRASAPMPD